MISASDEVFGENQSSEPFNRFSDAQQIRSALNHAFRAGVDKMCKQIGEILRKTKKSLADLKMENVEETVILLNR